MCIIANQPLQWPLGHTAEVHVSLNGDKHTCYRMHRHTIHTRNHHSSSLHQEADHQSKQMHSSNEETKLIDTLHHCKNVGTHLAWKEDWPTRAHCKHRMNCSQCKTLQLLAQQHCSSTVHSGSNQPHSTQRRLHLLARTHSWTAVSSRPSQQQSA